MTRAQGPDAAIDYRMFGAPGADRVVVILREGAAALSDPDPAVTARGDLRVLAIRVSAPELDDSAVYGGETPASSTLAALEAVEDIARVPVLAIVAERATGVLAAHLTAALGARADRLVLVAVRRPESALERDVLAPVLAEISAVTLVLHGADDPGATDEDARWWTAGIRSARTESVAVPPGHDRRLSLTAAWPRVLAGLGG